VKGPNAPHLQCGFYFDTLSEAEAFAHMTEYLLARRAEFTGRVMVVHGSGVRTQNVRWELLWGSDERTQGIKEESIDRPQLMAYLVDSNVKVLQVGLKNVIATSANGNDIVGYVPMSRSASASGKDKHAIEILSEGAVFCGPPGNKPSSAERRMGKHARETFLSVVEVLSPAYATITVEIELKNPWELAHGLSYRAFSDFFVNEGYIGPENAHRISKMYRGAYIEKVKNGLYVSCYGPFNPNDTNVDTDERLQWSAEVATMIAARHRRAS